MSVLCHDFVSEAKMLYFTLQLPYLYNFADQPSLPTARVVSLLVFFTRLVIRFTMAEPTPSGQHHPVKAEARILTASG